MSLPAGFTPDPERDLVLTREIDVPPAALWKAWTEPERVQQWFTPRPWTTPECEIDLRPGGIFRTVMRGPDGEEGDGTGCYLEIVPHERLVWTSAMSPGFRPNPPEDLAFTAIISIEAIDSGTRYTVVVMHSTVAGARQHEEMGFFDGWGAAIDQLVEHVKSSS
ncbi:MAG: polyketide cyclase [Actinobacteria bacterium]|nr:polyketide cyclase [Actinomycetota bacterium]